MDDVGPEVTAWLAAFAAELGVAPPTPDEVDAVLVLAGVAAHASARPAAPVACWLAARAGLDPTTAIARADAVAPTAASSGSAG